MTGPTSGDRHFLGFVRFGRLAPVITVLLTCCVIGITIGCRVFTGSRAEEPLIWHVSTRFPSGNGRRRCVRPWQP
ncbi:hypothetical protein FMEAI12_1670050 [Parafrankia sp. Ea1.12]|nr:hypothetical protein FMEAI12_1670050 [Parafrankia sp. Ea1.12]